MTKPNGSGIPRDDQKSHSDREAVDTLRKRNPEIRRLFMLKMAFHIDKAREIGCHNLHNK